MMEDEGSTLLTCSDIAGHDLEEESERAISSRTVNASSEISPATVLLSRLKLESRPANVPVAIDGLFCEDCLINKAIRMWRWCRCCERVLCEGCAVARHLKVGEAIEDYASAYRRLGEEFQKSLGAAGATLEKLKKGAAKIGKLGVDAVKQAEEMKPRVLMDAEMDADHGQRQQLMDSMDALAARPFSASWKAERERIERDWIKMRDEMKIRNSVFEKELIDANVAVNKFAMKVDEAFRLDES